MKTRIRCFMFVLVLFWPFCQRLDAQGALLMEEPHGIAGILNPTGHDALYFARICAATSVRLRRCEPGETGSVIARYQGIRGLDWIAIPLIPYLYAVEDASAVPERVDRATVTRLREQYHAAHLLSLGENVPEGGEVKRGWSQVVGAAYERRIFALRFVTTESQDDALIAQMNGRPNVSHFNLLIRNCSDFSGRILNFYFPRTFRRSILPDAGITTPRRIAYKLERYERGHGEGSLRVVEIPQVPGYQHGSMENKGIAAGLIATGYVIPIAVFEPYIAAGIVADYLMWGRYPLPLRGAHSVRPQNIVQELDSSSRNDGAADR